MTATGARTVHVEHCMGTVFSIDVRDPGDWGDAIAAVVARLHHLDAVFSTYRPDSDISRLRRRELRLTDADPDVAVVLDLCAELQRETGGHFSALAAGRIDPTGLVKGWAVEEASRMLRAYGAGNHAVNGGGDVQLAGEAGPGREWTVGVVDPLDRGRILTTITGRDLAVATSGTAERGAHIVDPFTGRPVTHLAAATVTGPSLTRADAYATAAFVLGPAAIDWIATRPGYAVLLVRPDGSVQEAATESPRLPYSAQAPW
ncbi:MAG TPA: FAD:protein FMN transferase [Mycobacteriales bacterium]|nr:FAD:protein FMN transferase [Mycobacteriales bacterium]